MTNDTEVRRLGFYGAGRCVPGDRRVTEVGFVGHVAGQGGVVAADRVFDDRLSGADVLEEIPEVRADVIPVVSFIRVGLAERLLANLRVMLCVPFLEIRFAHRGGIAFRVVAGLFFLAGLWSEGHAEFGYLERAFGALEAVGF